jgi:hypothetical protein
MPPSTKTINESLVAAVATFPVSDDDPINTAVYPEGQVRVRARGNALCAKTQHGEDQCDNAEPSAWTTGVGPGPASLRKPGKLPSPACLSAKADAEAPVKTTADIWDDSLSWADLDYTKPTNNDTKDNMPDLVDESDNEDHLGEIPSECSSAGSADIFGFLRTHFEAHVTLSSDAESAEQDTTNNNSTEPLQCMVCPKPTWSRDNNPKYHHCRNFCTHDASRHVNADQHQDAPISQRTEPTTLPLLCSPLLPPEVGEIAAAAVRPVNRKKLKRLAKQQPPQQG